MTRYLLAAATVAGALSFATPATACDFEYCPGTSTVCRLGVVDCDDPNPVEVPCIYTTDFIICL